MTLTVVFVVPFLSSRPIGPSAFNQEMLKGDPATTPPSKLDSGIVSCTACTIGNAQARSQKACRSMAETLRIGAKASKASTLAQQYGS